MRSFLSLNCVGLTKTLATTTSHSLRARATSEMCPSCNAPIVGTKPIFLPWQASSSSRNAFTVETAFIVRVYILVGAKIIYFFCKKNKNRSDWLFLHKSSVAKFLTYAYVCCEFVALPCTKIAQSLTIFRVLFGRLRNLLAVPLDIPFRDGSFAQYN